MEFSGIKKLGSAIGKTIKEAANNTKNVISTKKELYTKANALAFKVVEVYEETGKLDVAKNSELKELVEALIEIKKSDGKEFSIISEESKKELQNSYEETASQIKDELKERKNESANEDVEESGKKKKDVKEDEVKDK